MFAIMVHIVPHAAELGFSTISAANILATIGGASVAGKVCWAGLLIEFEVGKLLLLVLLLC